MCHLHRHSTCGFFKMIRSHNSYYPENGSHFGTTFRRLFRSPQLTSFYRWDILSQPSTSLATEAPFPMAYSASGQFANLAQSSTYQNVTDDSLSPEASDGGPRDAQRGPHRRGYQACQRCRERKVKCDLGSRSCYTIQKLETLEADKFLSRCRCAYRSSV